MANASGQLCWVICCEQWWCRECMPEAVPEYWKERTYTERWLSVCYATSNSFAGKPPTQLFLPPTSIRPLIFSLVTHLARHISSPYFDQTFYLFCLSHIGLSTFLPPTSIKPLIIFCLSHIWHRTFFSPLLWLWSPLLLKLWISCTPDLYHIQHQLQGHLGKCSWRAGEINVYIHNILTETRCH